VNIIITQHSPEPSEIVRIREKGSFGSASCR
jgi:hypothetical protein